MSEIKEGNLAEIKDLSVSFMTDAGSIKAIDKISFEIPRKKVIGVVGESGSGKSVTARSLIKLLPETATTSGAVYLSNRAGTEELEVLSLSGEQLREMRGAEAAMVFQEPNSVLNPVYTIGWQIEEGLRAHGMKDKKELRAKSIDILKKVGIPDAETRIDYYPHQFSGGQKQRIVIAMALVLNPGLILADEPTTALDVTVQADILDLLRSLKDKLNTGILLITHPGVGSSLLAVATTLLRNLPLQADAFEVPFDADLEQLLPAASAALRRVDSGEGVLVLTDLYGASPSNLAARVARLGTPVRRVAALSLPMLLRVMNYPEQGLDELPATAAAGTRNGAIIDDA